jgi:Cell Wall Hydrolase
VDSEVLQLEGRHIVHSTELILGNESAVPSIRRGPVIVLGVIMMVVIAAAALVPRLLTNRGAGRYSDLSLELGPLPVVEPFIIRSVSPEVAREANAQIPMIAGLVPPAKPFRIGTSGTDVERAVDCLASTIYYEAGNETLGGQMAVAQVVLNRVRHPAFPKTVCGVVFQGSERRTGCQFSFTCDGSMASRRPSDAVWQRMRGIAISMLSGGVYAPVGNATHYHADYVLPYWSSSLEKVWVEGVHIFYRWAGGWGSPRAFVGRYAGKEQGLIIRPKPLDIGVNGLPTPGQPVVPLNAKIVEQAVATGATTAADVERGQYILRLDPALDPSQLPILAQQACGARDYCKVLGWSDVKKMPKGFPVPEEQLASMSFSYLRIKGQGFEKALWNCAIFPRTDKKQCIRERVVEEIPLRGVKPLEPAESQKTPLP